MFVFITIFAVQMIAPLTLLRCFWSLLSSGFPLLNLHAFHAIRLKYNTTWKWLLGDIYSERWALMVHVPFVQGKPSSSCFVKGRLLFSCICPATFLNRMMHKMNCLRALFLRWGFWEDFCVLCNKKLQSYLLLYASFWCEAWCQHQNSVLCWTKRTIGSSMMLISARLSDNSSRLVNWSHTLQWPDLVAPSRNEILQSRTYIFPIKTPDIC